ncbi:MAG: Fic family protein, partial [Devosiaceae bacterium]|nr:Fic family protein [Devosiaceae bacterium]
LHEIDLELGGNFMGVSDFSEVDRRQIIRRNLIEESIASSRLEGANTSREVAKKMLNEGREPKNKDEQMIVNNHKTMQRIEEELRYEPLSIELLKDIHKQVTKDTLQDASLEGELRETFDEKGNRLKIMPWDETTVTYVAPDREFVEQELPKLIQFANDQDDTIFIHPLTKAIMLHFWVGLLHPFEDGNGRLARIIFYWYILRKGYWAFSYLSLSERIIKSPKQYAMSYIYSEQDGHDLNYFIHYNMAKLKLARQHFQKILREKILQNKQALAIIRRGFNFNSRQLKLLQYLAKDEQRYTSTKSYHSINSEIGYVTAISDLKKLVSEGFLEKVKNGRNVFYYPTQKIHSIIK